MLPEDHFIFITEHLHFGQSKLVSHGCQCERLSQNFNIPLSFTKIATKIARKYQTKKSGKMMIIGKITPAKKVYELPLQNWCSIIILMNTFGQYWVKYHYEHAFFILVACIGNPVIQLSLQNHYNNDCRGVVHYQLILQYMYESIRLTIIIVFLVKQEFFN